MMNTETALALMRSPGSNPRRLRAVMNWARLAKSELEPLLGLREPEIVDALPPALADAARMIAACSESLRERSAREWERAGRAGVTALRYGDTDYPAHVQDTLQSDAPPILFVAGSLDLLREPGLGIVGARRCSAAGVDRSRSCARFAARLGASVVSGGAPGIDEAAHEEALHGRGSTVLVLPQGILRFRASSACMEAVESGAAALVSAAPPSEGFTTASALSRNALVCAHSRVVCVIGPKDTGGSIHAARRALAQHRPLFVWCEEAHRDVQDRLEREGAQPLVDEAGGVRTAALEEAWAAAHTLPRQPDLL